MKNTEEKAEKKRERKVKVKDKKPRKRHPIATTAALTAAFAVSIGVCEISFNQVQIEPEDLLVETSANRLYSSEEITIEGNDTNAEFIGMAGDKNYVEMGFKLTKKDGSPFVDDVKNTWIGMSSEDDKIGWQFGYVYSQIDYTCPSWLEKRYAKSHNEMYGSIEDRDDIYSTVEYFFEDESTVSARIYSNTVLGGLKGETMTAALNGLSAYTNEEKLCDHSEYENTSEEEGSELNSLLEKYSEKAADGHVVIVDPATQDIMLCRETPLDLNIDLSVKLTYKTDKLNLTAVNVEKAVDGWGVGSEGEFGVTPFGIKFRYTPVLQETDDEPKFNMWGGNVEKIMDLLTEDYSEDMVYPPDELTVEMKDGSRITAKTDYLFFSVEDGTEQYRFYGKAKDGRLCPVTILPDDIVKIEMNGVEVYSLGSW